MHEPKTRNPVVDKTFVQSTHSKNTRLLVQGQDNLAMHFKQGGRIPLRHPTPSSKRILFISRKHKKLGHENQRSLYEAI